MAILYHFSIPQGLENNIPKENRVYLHNCKGCILQSWYQNKDCCAREIFNVEYLCVDSSENDKLNHFKYSVSIFINKSIYF